MQHQVTTVHRQHTACRLFLYSLDFDKLHLVNTIPLLLLTMTPPAMTNNQFFCSHVRLSGGGGGRSPSPAAPPCCCDWVSCCCGCCCPCCTPARVEHARSCGKLECHHGLVGQSLQTCIFNVQEDIDTLFAAMISHKQKMTCMWCMHK